MLAWFGLFALIAFAGTLLARRYAVTRQLLDQPGERRSHSVATPRGGGAGIVLALVIAGIVLVPRFPGERAALVAYLVALLAVAGIGWRDDHRPLSAWLRLAVHAIAAATLAAGIWLTYGSAPMALATFAAALVLTNVWNFMDGIDGIAAGQAMIVALALAFANAGPWSWLALALAAAALGFLPLNVPRARIFMGDVGSGALGLTIALLAATAGRADPASWLLVALPLSAFLVDAGLTLARRMLRGERWWTAHVQHAYQRVAAKAGRHLPVTLAYAVWALLATVAMILIRPTSAGFILLSAAACYTSAAFCWALAQRWASAPSSNRPLPNKPSSNRRESIRE